MKSWVSQKRKFLQFSKFPLRNLIPNVVIPLGELWTWKRIERRTRTVTGKVFSRTLITSLKSCFCENLPRKENLLNYKSLPRKSKITTNFCDSFSANRQDVTLASVQLSLSIFFSRMSIEHSFFSSFSTLTVSNSINNGLQVVFRCHRYWTATIELEGKWWKGQRWQQEG